ncbi:transcription initiation factor IIB [Halorientalis pallida]|uniref:Transcription initiation factor IIB n=1 Tax=Halorientalis pallida TaxID=2479928 RepID=A0A498KY74_9EURY|nr:transcription initiation factor IIB family protein [Halorientalis pallida]RXK50601.1 transcription initiation factor IIB family protein [Halorientalis pallida]
MATSTQSCPECDGRLREGESETVCGECGLVVAEETIDHGPEWRSFADDETEKERTGAPLTRSRHDRGLTTEIGRSTRLKGRKRRRFARLRRQHNRSRIKSKAERNRVYAFGEIRRLVSALDLTDHVRDQSCILFESAQSEDLLRGRSIEGFTAAVVYATCRTTSVSRTLDEVVEAARASESELTAAYDALNRDLGLPTGPIDPAEYLPRFASRLDLPQAVERRADTLVDAARERGLISGRDPSGVAAGCLYLAARELECDLTQAQAAETAGVTPVTLRSTYQDLQE